MGPSAFVGCVVWRRKHFYMVAAMLRPRRISGPDVLSLIYAALRFSSLGICRGVWNVAGKYAGAITGVDEYGRAGCSLGKMGWIGLGDIRLAWSTATRSAMGPSSDGRSSLLCAPCYGSRSMLHGS